MAAQNGPERTDVDLLRSAFAHTLSPNSGLEPSQNIATTTSLVDLLTASAHDPARHDDDSDDEEDDRKTDLEGSLSSPETPPTSEEGGLSWKAERQLAVELSADAFDTEDEAIIRAQKPDSPEAFAEEYELTPTERDEIMQRVKEEFGPWTDDSEEIVRRIPGALERSVYIRGSIVLTNRRIVFMAYIPHFEAHQLIRSGPLTHHPAGSFTAARRLWGELRADCMVWYKNSASTYKPMGACRLSQVRRVLPLTDDEPCYMQIEMIDGRLVRLELDLPESAKLWHDDMRKALFAFRANADTLKVGLALDQIQYTERENRTAIVESCVLHFRLDTGEDDSVRLCWLKSRSWFSDLLDQEISKAKSSPPSTFRAILELEGNLRSAEMDARREEQVAGTNSLAYQICRAFALYDDPQSLYVVKDVELVRAMPTWGSLAVSELFVLFWKKAIVGQDVMLRLPIKDLDDAGPCKAFGFHVYGLALQVHGAPTIRLDFHSQKTRNNVIEYLKERIQLAHQVKKTIEHSSPMLDPLMPAALGSPMDDSSPSERTRPTPQKSIDSASSSTKPSLKVDTWVTEPKFVLGCNEGEVIGPVSDHMSNDNLRFRPAIVNADAAPHLSDTHFVCLTIGSRGDVQPYIALGLELMKWGNRVTIASHPEYREWVESYGIGYREVGGDPAALMKLSVEHKMFSPGFFKESLGHFRTWLDDLFHESWVACQGADVLIESPSTMAGIHVAEALNIPYFRAFTMPWTSTATYPHAFAASMDLGPTYNLLSYSMFDSIIWRATSGQVNRWRKKELGIRSTSEKKMAQTKTPFIYNFSEAIVPRPNDWKDHIYVSGYWFLNDNKPFDPPEGLLDFIDKAHKDGKAVVYVGFGSITVPDAGAVTKAIVQAVHNADVRVVLSKGWSERGAKKPVDDVPLPPEIFSVKSIDHAHLFPRIDAAMHHGGAGTTAASLRAGLPTLICPFFGDQHFWASRVQKLGAGVHVTSLNEQALTAALKKGTTDRVIREKAQAVGEKLRAENGCEKALRFIANHLGLASRRSQERHTRSEKRDSSQPSSRSSTPTGAAKKMGIKSPLRSSTLPSWISGSPRTSLDGGENGHERPDTLTHANTTLGI